ncbi:hypothetical protein OAV47_01405 [bacterium]|nr:hypothetical protein [bacterium]
MAPQPSSGEGAGDYVSAWGEIARSMEAGVSWSGHERNVAWLNSERGEFVDVSAVSGLDHAEDGRVALRCDWDGDGDLDLWLRFRSGPTLRYLENQADPERHLAFDPGVPGASVVVETRLGEVVHRTLLQTRTADGYLAGVRQRAVLALQPNEVVLDGAALASQGARVVERPEPRPALAAGELQPVDLPARVVLRSSLSLPGEWLGQMGFERGRAQLVIVEDPDCAACREVLPAAVAAVERDGRLGLTRLNTRNPAAGSAVRWLSMIATHLLGPGAELDTPLSLLVGPDGRLEVARVGDLEWGDLSRDVGWFGLQPVQGAFRSSFDPPGVSRWFHGMARSTAPLAQDLLEAGFVSESAHYSK